jgi:hypothetical protein
MDTHKTDAGQSVLSSGDEVKRQTPELGNDDFCLTKPVFPPAGNQSMKE